jgi:hypothetical protein
VGGGVEHRVTPRRRVRGSMEPRSRRHRADMALWVVVLVFVAIAAPVVVRGAPLADDFTNCVTTERSGFASALAGSIDRLGASRKAHLIEIVLTGGVCGHAPFGIAIAVPLVLTIAIAFLLRGLLVDIGVPRGWADVGGALWLLSPLGTESALWPAALHVPLGIALALLAVRLHRADRPLLAGLAVVGAGLSIEQVLLALPLAVWMTTPRPRTRRAVLQTAAIVAALVVAFVVWPGNDPRLHVTLGERIAAAVHDPLFPFRFVAVGVGLQSIPLAVAWAFPASIAALAAGGWLGSRIAAALGREDAPRERVADGGPTRIPSPAAAGLGCLALVVALNVPVILNVPHEGSPRLFAPSWLVIAASVAIAGSSIRRDHLRAWGAIGGAFAAGALLSLALSVWVRVESADFTQYAAARVAAGLPGGSTVAVCGVTRTVVRPAPRGSFALHEFDYDWAARDAVEFYTGKHLTFVIAGTIWGNVCAEPSAVDRVVSFPRLVSDWWHGG